MATTVGVLGIGIMGRQIATHLRVAGHPVLGFDPLPDRAALLAGIGATAAGSVREVVEGADAVLLSLPGPPAAAEVVDDIVRYGRTGLVVADTSTLGLDLKAILRDVLAAAGVTLLDCPLSGTGAQAETRDVVVYGSGDPAAFEALRPVFEAFSRSVRYLGDFGAGSVLKYIANLLVSVHNVVTAEAFAVADRAGLDRGLVWEAIRDGAGNSVIFEKRGPLMVRDEYLPATAKISMFVKDVGLIREFARSQNLSTPTLDAAAGVYEAAMAAGLADLDAAAVLTVLSRRDDR